MWNVNSLIQKENNSVIMITANEEDELQIKKILVNFSLDVFCVIELHVSTIYVVCLCSYDCSEM